MSEIVRRDVVDVAPVASESTAMIDMLERAARDPNVDIDKLERLMAMKERMEKTAAQRAYDEAFAAMQPELPEIDRRGKIIIREKNNQERIIQSTPYALWEDINRMIKPILAKYGFGLSFRVAQTDARLITTAVLSHKGGHREETGFSAPIDNTGSKNNVQGWGSSMTYGKRYAGTAILNITTRGEDDDGKAAGAPAVISDAQVHELIDLIHDTKTDINAFLRLGNVESLSDIACNQFEPAKARLLAKKAQMMKARKT